MLRNISHKCLRMIQRTKRRSKSQKVKKNKKQNGLLRMKAKIKLHKWKNSSNKVQFTSNSYLKKSKKLMKRKIVMTCHQNYSMSRANSIIFKRNTTICNKKSFIRTKISKKWQKSQLLPNPHHKIHHQSAQPIKSIALQMNYLIQTRWLNHCILNHKKTIMIWSSLQMVDYH